VDKLYYRLWRLWNRTGSRWFSIDIYGVRLFGIQFTPKSVAYILTKDNDGKFSEHQLYYYRIYLIFNSHYVFIPRLERHLE